MSNLAGRRVPHVILGMSSAELTEWAELQAQQEALKAQAQSTLAAAKKTRTNRLGGDKPDKTDDCWIEMETKRGTDFHVSHSVLHSNS